MASVHDVATFITEKLGQVDALRLQKLVYYCQGWHLAWEDALLFPEHIQAWANGPVVYELFKCHRGRYTITASNMDCGGNSDNLLPNERETINAVLKSYGELSGRQLSIMTHNEDPWKQARADRLAGEPSTNQITIGSIASFFQSLDADPMAEPVENLKW